MLPIRRSAAVRTIDRLIFGRWLALRLYNRFLMHLRPQQVATTYFGARMNVDVRDFLQATILHYGTWEPNVATALEEWTRSGDTVVDIGANVGFDTLLLAQKVGPQGRVIAVEAHPRFAARLRENVELNDFDNVRVEAFAIADTSADVMLHEGPRSNGGSSTIRASRGLAPAFCVRASPLMSLLTEEEIARTHLIKIDIEGAEGPVLREILSNIHRFPERLGIAVEANPQDDEAWPEIFSGLISHGFSAMRVPNIYCWERIEEEAEAERAELAALPSGVVDIFFARGAS